MIVTLLSFKGGVGKTTSAVHIAALLHEHAQTVLADGDANRSALAWAARGKMPMPVIDELQLMKKGRDAAHIVIDTPARPEQRKLAAYAEGADLLILCAEPDALSLDAALPAIEALQKLGASFRVLLTTVPPGHAGPVARELLTSRGANVFAGLIRRYTVYQRAALAGCLVSEVRDDHAADAWSDYKAIAREILD